MEVPFSPEQEMASRLIEDSSQFCATVRQGLAQVERGELIDDDEVRLWLETQERS